MHPFSSSMNQRQFPASLNRFLTWLMLIAALVAVAVLLATPGVVWGQNPPIAKDTIPIQNLTVGTDLALEPVYDLWNRLS